MLKGLAVGIAAVAWSASAHATTVYANDLGAKGDGTTLDTAAIQKAIDTAAPKHDTVSFKPGTYLTGALFMKTGVTFEVPEGVTLTGAQELKDFPELPTRIAGIEMTWPAAMINVRDQHDVTITGKGTIDGNGQVWWKAYRDLRAGYEPKGLRWAADYDSKRVRLSVIVPQYRSVEHYGGGRGAERGAVQVGPCAWGHGDGHSDHGLNLQGVATPISITMNWNPSYSYATLPAGTDPKTVPPYWIPLTTPVPADKGLPHFSNVHIWNIKATGAKKAFSVAAYSEAPLVDFKLDHLDIEAQSTGSIADAKNWTFSDVNLKVADGSEVKLTGDANLTGLP